jgi:hypothetical protein
MALPSCEECKAIYQELLELEEISRQTKPDPAVTLRQLAAWIDQRDKDEDYKMRTRPALATLRRRLIEHQELTGHGVPWALPPGGLNNAN